MLELTIINGPQTGRTLASNGEAVVVRRPSPDASRRPARDGGWTVRPFAGGQRVTVNGKPADGRTAVRVGDRIAVGEDVFEVRRVSSPDPPAADDAGSDGDRLFVLRYDDRAAAPPTPAARPASNGSPPLTLARVGGRFRPREPRPAAAAVGPGDVLLPVPRPLQSAGPPADRPWRWVAAAALLFAGVASLSMLLWSEPTPVAGGFAPDPGEPPIHTRDDDPATSARTAWVAPLEIETPRSLRLDDTEPLIATESASTAPFPPLPRDARAPAPTPAPPPRQARPAPSGRAASDPPATPAPAAASTPDASTALAAADPGLDPHPRARRAAAASPPTEGAAPVAPPLADAGPGVFFLLDASGSMVDRLPTAIVHLKDRLENVEPGRRVVLVVFNGRGLRVLPAEGVAPLTDETRRRLLAELAPDADALIPFGPGDRVHALRFAIAHARAGDQLVLITDPTSLSGDPDGLYRRVAAVMAGCDLRISTVQLFDERPDDDLRRIAEDFGGHHDAIRPARVADAAGFDAWY